MAFTPKLTYKGKPLVRKDNELYYGRMTDPYVLRMQILSTKPVGGMEVADKVHIVLLSTDEDYLTAIEAFEDNPPMADAGVSDQTRIADALEDMVALSLPDDTTNTTEE